MTHAFGQDIAILNEIADENTREMTADLMAVSEPFFAMKNFLEEKGISFLGRNMLRNFNGKVRNAFPIYGVGKDCHSFLLIYIVDRENKTSSFVIEPNHDNLPIPEGLEMLKEEKTIHFPRKPKKYIQYYIGRNGKPAHLTLEEVEKYLGEIA